jgi:hypothetical protein
MESRVAEQPPFLSDRTTELAQALARAVLAGLPASVMQDNIHRRLRDVSLDGLTLTTSTRTERRHPAGGQTVIALWLECEVSHRPASHGATEVADACRDELGRGLKTRSM